MTTHRPCPAHTPNRRDVAFPPARPAVDLAGTKTVVVEFVEESRHRVQLQVPADCSIDDIEAALSNMLADENLDGFVDLVRHIEHVEVLRTNSATHA